MDSAAQCRCQYRPGAVCINTADGPDGLCTPCRIDGGDGHPHRQESETVVVGLAKPDADGNFAPGVDGAVLVPPADLYDGVPTAGESTCPVCSRTWTVTPFADCFMPACGCFGFDSSEANPNRPCESCGMSHAWKCEKRP